MSKNVQVFDPCGASQPEFFLHLVPADNAPDEADLIAVDADGDEVTALLHIASKGVYRYPNVDREVAEYFGFPLLARSGRLALDASTQASIRA